MPATTSDFPPIPMVFTGKTAVVTGAASGIGYAFAQKCVEEGMMKVVIVDLDSKGLAEAKDALETLASLKTVKTSIVTVQANLQIHAEVERMFQVAVGKTADCKVHLVFNNAGMGGEAMTVLHSSPAQWEKTMMINFDAVLWGSHLFGKHMVDQAKKDPEFQGHIVNTASLASYARGMGAYGASKRCCHLVSEQLYTDLMELGQDIFPRVGCSVLCPGMVRTDIWRQSKYTWVEPEIAKGASTYEQANMNSNLTKQEKREQVVKRLVRSGLDPGTVANMVFERLRGDKRNLYMYPHADQASKMVREAAAVWTDESGEKFRRAFRRAKL